MGGPSDEALLAGVAAGDEHAATAFVRRHQQRVFGLCRAVVGEPGLAADAAQEAFLRAWRHADAYDPRRGSVVTWLLAIARNVAIDRLRLERVRPFEPIAVDRLVLASGDLDVAESAVLAEEVARVVAALARVPAEQRRAVVLAAVHGRTAAEIGEIEGIPLGTAKTRIRSGLAKVRERLEVQEREHG